VKLVALVLVVAAAGCASAPLSPSAPVSASRDVAVPAPEAAAPAPGSATQAAIAAIPPSASASHGIWSGAGGDEPQEVRVTATRESDSPLREERLVGSNEQPEWTTERRWAKTRAYVIAPGQIEFEQWYKLQTPKGSAPDHFWQTEVGMGFEGGWQGDIYLNYGHNPGGPTKYEGAQFEVRKALGKWGEIWANPTLYLEYVANQRSADKWEAKILLADELCPGWHWGSNLVYEQETSGARETELALSGAVSYTLKDSAFSVGAEFNLERVTGKGFQSNDAAVNEFLIGPAFQWRPTENCHVDFSPLFGLTHSDREDPRYEIWLIFGWDFGPEREGHSGPNSTRGR
jgi:hypothetical protein